MTVDNKDKKRNGKKVEASKLFSQLPKGLEHLDMLQVGMNLVQEAQKQAHVIKKGAMIEAGKVFIKLQSSYGEMSSKFTDVSEMAKKQAEERMATLIRKWNERKEILPKKLTKEVDQFLSKSGLMKDDKKATKTPVAKTTAKPSARASAKPASKTKAKAAPKAKAKTASPSKKKATGVKPAKTAAKSASKAKPTKATPKAPTKAPAKAAMPTNTKAKAAPKAPSKPSEKSQGAVEEMKVTLSSTEVQ